MALRSTQPLLERRTRKFPGVKGRSARKADNLPPSMSQLSRRSGSLDVSHTYGPLQPVVGTALCALIEEVTDCECS
jgi:hypothetical protein